MQNFDHPESIGPFTVLSVLGTGAMGRVFLARSEAVGLAAVKVIRADLAADPVYRKRFAREIGAARRVTGGYTAAVLDADPFAERPWLAAEYIAAPTLAELIDVCGPLPEACVKWLAVGCLRALISVHRVGLIHRDVKPGNILVAEQGPRLIDFGLARAAGSSHLTSAGMSVGTPAFMAPEQLANDELSAAADVYALGATLAYAASGQPPFPGPGVEATVFQLLTGVPDLAGVPERMALTLAACLARAPGSRPSCEELLAEFEESGDPDDPGGSGGSGGLGGTHVAAPLPARARELVERHAAAAEFSPYDLYPTLVPAVQDAVTAAVPKRAPAARTSRRRAKRSPARAWMVASACATAVIGVTAGIVFGLLSAWPSPPAAQSTAATKYETAAGSAVSAQGQPPPFPPPDGAGGPPPSGGVPIAVLAIQPPVGAPGTVFIVTGEKWPPGQPISITLDVSGSAPVLTLAGPDGTFRATFYPGAQEHRTNGSAPGDFLLHAYAGPAQAEVTFTVVAGSPSN